MEELEINENTVPRKEKYICIKLDDKISSECDAKAEIKSRINYTYKLRVHTVQQQTDDLMGQTFSPIC